MVVRGDMSRDGAVSENEDRQGDAQAPREAPVPLVGQVEWGALRRVTPISRAFGFERGRPIDRYYIEQFLQQHSEDVRGRALEIGDDEYTRRFGGPQVTQSDILSLTLDNNRATIIADLSDAPQIHDESFDCMIFTQTMQFIYDLRAAAVTIHRILKPGGVLLATFPFTSQICRYDMERWGDYWRFTTASIGRLFGDAFGAEQVEVEAFGNVLATISFLQGLAAEELRVEELDYQDPDYQMIITARAVKRGAG
ncbi:MAG: methyltransferase domain-containing protein [Herpetosiphonaceae bacterium]|nr:methyltransferase domain-containing protein [Herpetosiphonaceae bacterium]